MIENVLNTDFSNPKELLKTLTGEEVSYDVLTSFATNLMGQIEILHTNQEGRKFQAVTQCILECYKRICGFTSTQWIAENKLVYELKSGQELVSFTRINMKHEICLYKMANFDQIDFSREIEFADEYQIIGNKPQKSNIASQENSDYFKILTLLQNGENVFVTGFAGTGKSYILNKLKEKFKKKLTITSTTGIAAVNVKGQTLHSWAGVGLCRNTISKTVEKIKGRRTQYKQILNCHILAIDEISMLNIETFEYVNEVLKLIRECDKPFGGIQVLFIGDFYQLPPVNNEEQTELKYCFDSYVWDELDLKNVVLKKNYRQNEESFIRALSNMRTNCLNDEDIRLLNGRCVDSDTYQTDMLHIFSTNDEANRYNFAKFNMIEEPIRILTAEDAVYRGTTPVYDNFTESESYILEIFSKNCRAEKEIQLKLGAKVMLLVNMDFNKGLINGACGTIQEFNENSISIKFDNGTTVSIPKHKFEYYYNDRVVATRTQYPLRLAYGITIHKSQGMTLDKLVVDCSRIFEKGQAYVAISRVKTLDGLYLKSFEPEKVLVDSHVTEFYEKLEEVGVVIPNPSIKEQVEEESAPEMSDEEAKAILIECVSEFSGQYGKSGLCKILTGSKAVKTTEYNDKITKSKFLGALDSKTQKAVGVLIDELVENKTFIVKKISFGRPIICINKK